MCWEDGGRLGSLIMGNYRGNKMERGESLTCVLFIGIGKILGWGCTFTQRARGRQGELLDGVWFVKMVWGVGGWCVVCILGSNKVNATPRLLHFQHLQWYHGKTPIFFGLLLNIINILS